jgi:ABC-type nickel/cobalt efflux system permease component RcnA
MGIWLELGIVLVILAFGFWQLYDVKKAIRERKQRKTHDSASGNTADATPGDHQA